MTDAPHAFENDVTIEQEVENGEVIYSAYADGNPRSIWKTRAVALLADKRSRGSYARHLHDDFQDIVAGLNVSHPEGSRQIAVYRYRYQWRQKLISHIIVLSAAEFREPITRAASDAFAALDRQIDPRGGSSVEWFDANDAGDMSAHQRLKSFGRVQSALKIYRQTQRN